MGHSTKVDSRVPKTGKKLKKWCDVRDISPTRFGEMVGAAGKHATVQGWFDGTVPRPPFRKAIGIVTGAYTTPPAEDAIHPDEWEPDAEKAVYEELEAFEPAPPLAPAA